MKKQRINFSWPAYLSDFATDSTQENFSRGKLKVFYKGETADHRYFSSEFSEQLIASLPYTPVVSYYDEEKDDFVGHATEQQILGIVDPCIPPSFVQDEQGIEWCICDVVLYTERPDQVGKLAQRVAGHAQSLELDPHSVKYTINYDERRHFKNVEFTAGRFVGVSVLGLDQKPAFTGSEFFTCNDAFENKLKMLKDYCETKSDQTHGDTKMNFQEFMKLSWGDISVKVAEAIEAEYQEEYYVSIVDMFNDCVIAHFCSYIDDTCKLMRVKYSCKDGIVTLGDINEVHVVYEDVPSVETGAPQTEESFNVEEDSNNMAETPAEMSAEEITAVEVEPISEPETRGEVESSLSVAEEMPVAEPAFTENTSVDESVEDASVESAEVTETKKVSVVNEQAEEANSGTASFVESERAELEAFKREKKLNLLDSYKEYLSDEDYSSFSSSLDDFEADTLEIALLRKYKTYQEARSNKPMRAFSLSAPKTNVSENSLDLFVRKNLSR